jgi:pantetheine-phosphate adenylyltransferase
MSERVALFPGTFDPVTFGHLDLVRRGARLFDRLVVCVAPNARDTWLDQGRRVDLIRLLLEDERMAGVEVLPFDGLLVDVARRQGALALLRGVRTVRDFEVELEMAFANRQLHEELETVFLAPSPASALVSSTLVREVLSLGGDVSAWVPPAVVRALEAQERAGGADVP